MDHLRFSTVPDLRSIQNQPTSTADSPSDEPMAEADEPPDELEHHFGAVTTMERSNPLRTTSNADFKKLPMPANVARKQSLLTQTLHTSDDNDDEDDSQHDDEPLFSGSNRAHSSASTWSRGSRASTADFTSDGHMSPVRSGSPSPATRVERLIVFNHESFKAPTTIKIAAESIDPLKKSATPTSSNEEAVEKGLGRKRCIMFACKAPVEQKKDDAPPPVEERKEAAAAAAAAAAATPVKRPCALKFVCPSRGNTTPTANGDSRKPSIRLMSPPPPVRRIPASPRMVSPKVTRGHRSSDSTVRNESPKSVRKMPSVLRRSSSKVSEVPVSEATRFHEFASSEEEREDWTQEASVYRSRLTVQDTLKIENKLRHVCEEADEEAMEEEEAEEQLEAMEDVDDIDEDDEDDEDNQSLVDSTGYVTDEGFHTDDEEGFANSDDDDDSDADSDYAWWAPGAASGEQIEHIRPSTRRSESGSSIGSFSSTRVFPSKTPKVLKRSKTNPIEFRPRTPELPDSTDFVCGTLDEDRPLEEAWLSCRNQRRAAMHRPCPQDIDPTFPTSDPEMDEEDEEGYEDAVHMDDSDAHFFQDARMSDIDEVRARSPRRLSIVPQKRSPVGSPRRLRSPPPTKRAVLRSPPAPTTAVKRAMHRSPPPPVATKRLHSPPPPAATAGASRHLLFGHSPRRMHSPPPRRPLRSPPPSRRTSFTKNSPPDVNATPVPIALAQRPRFAREASSLPRNGPFPLRRNTYFDDDEDDDGDETQTDNLPTRGAIDIVKGLEKKRARRKEKLYEKHCRLRTTGKGMKGRRESVVLPGQGAEKMKRMGEGLCKARGHGAGWKNAHKDGGIFSDEGADIGNEGGHILSY